MIGSWNGCITHRYEQRDGDHGDIEKLVLHHIPMQVAERSEGGSNKFHLASPWSLPAIFTAFLSDLVEAYVMLCSMRGAAWLSHHLSMVRRMKLELVTASIGI